MGPLARGAAVPAKATGGSGRTTGDFNGNFMFFSWFLVYFDGILMHLNGIWREFYEFRWDVAGYEKVVN